MDKYDITQYANDFQRTYRTTFLQIDGADVFNMFDTVNKINAVSNKKYYDALGKSEKEIDVPPFFFDVTDYVIQNAMKAENVDTKDMIISATSPSGDHLWQSYVLRAQNRKWMDQVNFGQTLNDMTETDIRYGGLLVKRSRKVVKGKEYPDIQVMRYANCFFNPFDIVNGVKMFEIMADDWEIMDEIESPDVKRKWMKASDANKHVYMLYGYLSEAYVSGSYDENSYSWQWHKIVDIEGVKYKIGSELMDKNIFYYKPYQTRIGFGRDKKILGIGQTEKTFEFQAMRNILMNAQYRVVEMAGNVFFSTDDATAAQALQGMSVFDLQNGTVLPANIRSVDVMPSSAFNGMSNLAQSTDEMMGKAVQTGDVMLGEVPPSGTALGTVQIVNAEARGYYDMRQEERMLFLNDLYDEFIIDDLLKEIEGQDSVVGQFTSDELLMIDRKLSEQAFSETLVKNWSKSELRPKNVEELNQMREMSKQMYYDTKKAKGDLREIMVKDMRMDEVEFNVELTATNEQRNVQQYVASANQIAQAMVAAQGNPVAMKMLMKAADALGVNEAELVNLQ